MELACSIMDSLISSRIGQKSQNSYRSSFFKGRNLILLPEPYQGKGLLPLKREEGRDFWISSSKRLDSRRGGQSINSLPAVGTELKILLQLPPAPGAHRKSFLRERNGWSPSALVKNPAAPVALQKDFPALDREEGDEEEAEIMIQALQASRRRAAPRAWPRLIIHLNLLGLYPANKKEEDAPPVAGTHSHTNIPQKCQTGPGAG